MEKNKHAEPRRSARHLREKAQRESAQRAQKAERQMLRHITHASLLTMVLLPLLIDGVLHAFCVWVDTVVAAYYPSTAVTLLQWVLYYVLLTLRACYQFSGYAVLGYSVMRYSVSKSYVPMILSPVSVTITFLSTVLETVYLLGGVTIKSNLSYFLLNWILNWFLAVFTCFCIVFLCAMLRTAFLRRGRMQVGITEETKEQRRQNVLRRLYLWEALLLFFFTFFPEVLNVFYLVEEASPPKDIWDVISLLWPLVKITLFDLLGYFTMLWTGTALTKRDRLENTKES